MIDPDLSYEELCENINWLFKIGGYTKHNLYNKLNLYYGTDLYKAIKEEYPDDLPFYERKITKFKDKRVESFSLLIDIAKELFQEYNFKVNDFILHKVREYKNDNVWQTVAEEINNYEIVVWEEIIKSALELSFNYENINFSSWKKYIETHKKELSIKLNEIISKCQENKLEVSLNKRFKPL